MLNEGLDGALDHSSGLVGADGADNGADEVASRLASRDFDYFGGAPCFTPEIDLACQQVSNWTRCDNPGAFIHGLQRLGKSWCGRYIHQAVPMILGRSTISVLWSAVDFKQSKSEFLRDRLRQVKHPGFNHTRESVLSQRLLDHLVGLAGVSGATRILMIFDEAQKLAEAHYHQIAALTDALVFENIRPFVLQIGQPDLSTHMDHFETKNSMQLTGRFFPVSHEYMGIAIEDIADVLKEMDGPEGSSVIERFFPERAARNFQLSHAAQPMREALESLAAVKLLDGDIRLPMQYLRGAMSTLLYKLNASEGHKVVVDSQLMKICLEEVGFPKVMKLYSVPLGQA